MKTFTLRLTDTEAEALERLAALLKVSKNQAIKEVIAEKYCLFDVAATCIDGELDQLTFLSDFPLSVAKSDYSGATHIYELRAAKYVRSVYAESDDVSEADFVEVEDLIERITLNM